MRAIWKGSITFGLVNVPIKLYSATESHDVELHQVHEADGGRIRYQRRCEVCEKVVSYEDIAKAYDDGERTVILTDDDFAALPVERSREITVLEFVPSDQLDPIMMQKTYYLAPDSKSAKSYVLLRRTLEETDRTAIVNFTLREKTRLAALRVRDDVLVLQSLLWNDEVREADFPELDERVRISDKELEMSAALVASYESDFDPESFTDEYQVELRQLIEAKLEQGDALDTGATFGEPEEEGGEVLDLMEALRRSVEESRKKGGKAAPKETAAGGAAKASRSDGAADDAAEKDKEKKPAAKGAAEKGAAEQDGKEKKPAASSSRSKSATTRAKATTTRGKAASSATSAEEKKPTTRRKSPAKKSA